MRILLAEDERALSRAIIKIFEKNNYSADPVYNGQEALDYLESGNYDVLVLDIMMPVLDGISVLKKLRALGNNIPVIMLTAKSEIDDKVLGLDSGANDYLTKPFDSKELLARIRVITRSTSANDSKITFGNVTLDRATYTLKAPGGEISLQNKEYQMLEMLMSSKARVIPTERFMERIWGFESDSDINVVWVYVSNLRKKLKSIGADIKIKASRNVGYSLEEVK